MTSPEENRLLRLKLREMELSTNNPWVAFGIIGVAGVIAVSFFVYGSWMKELLLAQKSASAPSSTPVAREAAPVQHPPSVVHATVLFSKAVDEYRDALRMVYTAAAGGVYLPTYPFELAHHEEMLSMVSRQDLMSTIPNVRSIPAETDPKSLGYGICEGIKNADAIVEQVSGQYGGKLPEVLFTDVRDVRATNLYKYFSIFTSEDGCTAFLGTLRNARDPGGKNIHPIPHAEPKFSAAEFGAYVEAVHKMDADVKAIIAADSVSHR